MCQSGWSGGKVSASTETGLGSSSSSSSGSAFPAISLRFTILLLLHLQRSQLYLWGSPFFFFFIFSVPSYISEVHHSSSSSGSAFPAISLRFTILLLLHLQRSQLYLWGSPFFFFFRFSVPSYISEVHHSSSSSSSAFPAISLRFTILLLLHLQRSQLYLWGSPFFFFFRFSAPSYISEVHHSSSSSSSAFPAISLRFTILLLLQVQRSQLYLWGSPFFFFFRFSVPSYISGVHHSSSSSSSAIPAISLRFTILLLLQVLRSQLYLWGSPFFFFFRFSVPSYISEVHHSSSSASAFPAIYLRASPFLFFFSFSYISEVHHSSSSLASAFPAISLGFTILLLL